MNEPWLKRAAALALALWWCNQHATKEHIVERTKAILNWLYIKTDDL